MEKLKILNSVLLVAMFLVISACYNEEDLNVPVKTQDDVIRNEIDQYIEDNFTVEFGMAIRYRFVDRYVDPTQRVTPPRLESVRPMLDFIDEFWIGPYLEVENGEEFFRGHVPAEIVLLGGLIFNEDGTVILGTADAGAQITLTNVNAVDPDDPEWVLLQLQTIYHEFAHIVHQRYKLPTSFENISASGYTSAGSWFNLSETEALTRGFVTPYASSSPNEDFAETVAVFLFDNDFYSKFIDLEPDCETSLCEDSNNGRVLINQKLNSIRSHYQTVTGLDLNEIRESVQNKLD